ncbi:unnamed protein product [Protopolystoma xenopodis]|uniref:Uncharacterized protein n=1 Tax=Protopolystoma xenopodis TaxID=117903 RepID=A0A448WP27_9PLAT|nr:unnamed protein product [Protopolystoma xenopodis]
MGHWHTAFVRKVTDIATPPLPPPPQLWVEPTHESVRLASSNEIKGQVGWKEFGISSHRKPKEDCRVWKTVELCEEILIKLC